MPHLRYFLYLIKNIDSVAKMVWFRIIKKRLWHPKNSTPEFHLVIQQEVSERNYIKLSETKLDQFGNPAVEISWGVSSVDEENIVNAIKEFASYWSENFEMEYGKLHLYGVSRILSGFKNCGGIYHPTSSLSFGENADSQLNENLYFRGAKNIQFISTACLPTGGGVNPTMMALLLAARLVDQHSKNCR